MRTTIRECEAIVLNYKTLVSIIRDASRTGVQFSAFILDFSPLPHAVSKDFYFSHPPIFSFHVYVLLFSIINNLIHTFSCSINGIDPTLFPVKKKIETTSCFFFFSFFSLICSFMISSRSLPALLSGPLFTLFFNPSRIFCKRVSFSFSSLLYYFSFLIFNPSKYSLIRLLRAPAFLSLWLLLRIFPLLLRLIRLLLRFQRQCCILHVFVNLSYKFADRLV